jgi:adenylate cyclase
MEIERKFVLSTPPPDVADHPSREIRQGYLAIAEDGTEVRVRRDGDATVLTVKRGHGLTREEEEVAITAEDFDRLWPLTGGRRVEKTRHLVPAGDGRVVELDVYGGDLAGLVTAEVEFATVQDAQAFEPPEWLGRDVTGDPRFKNQRLALDGAPPRAAVGTR